MIGRWLAWTVLALTGAVTIAAQLDRAARDAPALAGVVPGPFRGFAAEERARIAIMAGDPAGAPREARALVRVRPMPAENLAMLFSAEVIAGDRQHAVAALEVAAQRGWREPVAQAASARAALEQGQYDLASQRVVALLATGRLPDATPLLVADLITSDAGRSALADRLAERGYWHRGVYAVAERLASPEQRTDLLVKAGQRGADVPCEQMRGAGLACDQS